MSMPLSGVMVNHPQAFCGQEKQGTSPGTSGQVQAEQVWQMFILRPCNLSTPPVACNKQWQYSEINEIQCTQNKYNMLWNRMAVFKHACRRVTVQLLQHISPAVALLRK